MIYPFFLIAKYRMIPMRSLIRIVESHSLPDSVFNKAGRMMRSNIDDGGGEGETVFLMIQQDFPDITEKDWQSYNRKFKSALNKWSLDRVFWAFTNIDARFRGDEIMVWREITAPADWKPDDRHPGVFWSWERNAAEAHWGSFSQGQVTWLMSGMVKFQHIDWVATLAANSAPDYENEKEIRIKEGAPVRSIQYERVK
jgi:hypothetical protein